MEAAHGCEKKVSFSFQQRTREGGRKVESRETSVTVPAGVDTGMTIQVPGQGADGDAGMPRGNLLVQFQVEDDAYFKRDTRKHEDLHVEVPVQVSQVICLLVVLLHGHLLRRPPARPPGVGRPAQAHAFSKCLTSPSSCGC